MVGSIRTSGLSTPTGLADNDLSHVAFLVLFDIEGEGADARGGEFDGVAMCFFFKKNIN